jgi:hypothetical protein
VPLLGRMGGAGRAARPEHGKRKTAIEKNENGNVCECHPADS